jgi:hypothetical protein
MQVARAVVRSASRRAAHSHKRAVSRRKGLTARGTAPGCGRPRRAWPLRPQGPKEVGDIDTDDEKDEEAEYEQWKSRELRRIRCGAPRLRLVARGGRAAARRERPSFLRSLASSELPVAAHLRVLPAISTMLGRDSTVCCFSFKARRA